MAAFVRVPALDRAGRYAESWQHALAANRAIFSTVQSELSRTRERENAILSALRANPIRAVEQTEGVLRVPGEMPAASGKPDHERVNDVLKGAMDRMLARLAQRYDPTIDDRPPLFGTVLDPDGLYAIIAAWREESWRDAEELRHARAEGGVDGALYRQKLADIEAAARAGAEAILAATQTDPARNAARNAYCQARA